MPSKIRVLVYFSLFIFLLISVNLYHSFSRFADAGRTVGFSPPFVPLARVQSTLDPFSPAALSNYSHHPLAVHFIKYAFSSCSTFDSFV